VAYINFVDIVFPSNMGGRTPKPLIQEVIRKYPQGKSRDQIAKETGIGAGTVSGIIKEFQG
jgi:hypothetical protein